MPRWQCPSKKRWIYIVVAVVLTIFTAIVLAQAPPRAAHEQGPPGSRSGTGGQAGTPTQGGTLLPAGPPGGGPSGPNGELPSDPAPTSGAPLHSNTKTLRQQEEEDKRHRFLATAIAFISLAVPLVLAGAALVMMYQLKSDIKTVARRSEAGRGNIARSHRIASREIAESQGHPDSPTRLLPGSAVEIDAMADGDFSDVEIEMEVKAGNRGSLIPPDSPSQLRQGRTNERTAGMTLNVAHISFWVTKTKPIWEGCGEGERSQILSDISASFKPGMTAIMGPSGSGKTTLLNLLAGRTNYGVMEGLFFLDGQLYSNSLYPQTMKQQGYVEQTDVFIEYLTVRESLAYSAMLKLPDSLVSKQKISMVSKILKEVGLETCADRIIGGTKVKGISGGQRRRLSIAKQVIHNPRFLILDEPTSGLDATSSVHIIELLQKMVARYRTTVILTIHQPRMEIYKKFQNLLLLTKGGHQAYFGDAQEAFSFFRANQRITVDVKKYDNHADYLMDATDTADGEALGKYWHESPLNRDVMGVMRAECSLDTIVGHTAANADTEESLAIGGSKRSGFRTQTWVLFARRAQRIFSAKWSKIAVYIQIFFVTLIIGDAFSYSTEDSDVFTPAYQSVMMLFIVASYGMIVQYLVYVNEYFQEREVITRERKAGTLRFESYITSGVLAETPEAIFQGALLLGIAYMMGNLNTDPKYSHFAFVIIFVGLSAWQSAIQLACMISDSIAFAYTLCFVILGLGTLYGGLTVNYTYIPGYFVWAYYTSVPALTYRALIFNDLYCCKYTATCDQFQNSMDVIYTPVDSAGQTANATCPAELLQEGGRTGVTNIGPAYLAFLNIGQPTKYRAVIAMCLMIALFRILAILLCWLRESWTDNLKEQNQRHLIGKLSRVTPLVRTEEKLEEKETSA